MLEMCVPETLFSLSEIKGEESPLLNFKYIKNHQWKTVKWALTPFQFSSCYFEHVGHQRQRKKKGQEEGV